MKLLNKFLRIASQSNRLSQMQSFDSNDFEKSCQLIMSNEDVINAVQLEKLKNILTFATQFVPFYKGIILDHENFSLEELKKFPIISKKDIIRNRDQFYPQSGKISTRGVASYTSGSTGDPFHFLVTRKSYEIENITVARSWWMTGHYKLNDPIVNLRSYSPSPSQPLWKYDSKDNFWYLSAFHINSETISMYAQIINKSGAHILRGYPSAIYLLALELRKARITLPNIKAIVTSSETLIEEHEKIIKSVLNVKIFDWYGLNERIVTVQRCINGNYHNNDDYGIIEVDSNGQIIGTSLNNNVFPFIRYATGDIAIPNEQENVECSCGCKFTIPFKRVVGRSDDFLYKNDETPIPTVNLYTGMYEIKGIKQFKVVQGLDKSLEVFVTLDTPQTTPPLVEIKAALRSRVGEVPVNISIVDQIPRNQKTGKIRTFESKIMSNSIFINDYVKSLTPYKLSAHKVWEVDKKYNSNVLKLDWNESVIGPSPKVISALEGIISGINFANWYPDTSNQELYEKISNFIKMPVSFIQYFAGSDSAHEYIARTFINPGDSVIVLSPTYDNFRVAASSQGAKVVNVEIPYFKDIDYSILESAIVNNKPKIVYIVNPNNPTGHFVRTDEIARLASEHTLTLFVIDEAYIEFGGESCVNLLHNLENIIVTRTFSKAFGIAAFRIGYIVTRPNLLDSINRIRNAKLISLPAQLAAIAALDDIQYMKNYCEEVNKAKNEFKNVLRDREFEFISGGGNFILINLQTADLKEIFLNNLENNNIFVRDMNHIRGLENWVRITIGTTSIMSRIYQFIKKY